MAARPIVYIEFPAPDPQAAGAFYTEIFGWQVHTDPEVEYHMFQAEGGPGGAFPRVGKALIEETLEYKAGEVLTYIASDDIDADLAKVEARGGQIVLPKTEISGIGWFGVFRDPAGNKVALLSSLSA